MTTPDPLLALIDLMNRADGGCWRMWANELRSGPVDSADYNDSQHVASFSSRESEEGGSNVVNLYFVQALVEWFRANAESLRTPSSRPANAREGGDARDAARWRYAVEKNCFPTLSQDGERWVVPGRDRNHKRRVFIGSSPDEATDLAIAHAVALRSGGPSE